MLQTQHPLSQHSRGKAGRAKDKNMRRTRTTVKQKIASTKLIIRDSHDLGICTDVMFLLINLIKQNGTPFNHTYETLPSGRAAWTAFRWCGLYCSVPSGPLTLILSTLPLGVSFLLFLLFKHFLWRVESYAQIIGEHTNMTIICENTNAV